MPDTSKEAAEIGLGSGSQALILDKVTIPESDKMEPKKIVLLVFGVLGGVVVLVGLVILVLYFLLGRYIHEQGYF